MGQFQTGASKEILSRYRSLLTATEPNGLIHYTRIIRIKSVTVAVGAEVGSASHNGVTAFTYFVMGRVVGNLLGFIHARLILRMWCHG